MLFRILGPIELHTPEAVHQLGAGKPAAVLATLLQQPNAWVTVDQLAEATWQGAAMPASAGANLKTYVWQLRRLLPAVDGGRLTRRADAYRLAVRPGEVDADRAQTLAARARTAGPSEAVAHLREALALWRGRPFCGVGSASSAAAGLEELRLELSEQLAALQLELGDTAEAVGTLRGVTSAAPLREPAWALLVRALHESGRRTEALLAGRRATDILRTELGVLPGPQLTAATRLLLSPPPRPLFTRPGSAPSSPPAPAARPGLAAFTSPSPLRRELPRDTRIVGRATELTRILHAAGAPAPLVLLTGPPGSGKTVLAVHAAHRLAPHYPDGQFFIPLRRPPSDVLGRLLRGIGLHPTDIPSDLDERTALWRSELATRRVLLVLDDARTRDEVWPLLPATTDSMALITARSMTDHLDGATHIPLSPSPATTIRPAPSPSPATTTRPRPARGPFLNAARPRRAAV